MKNSLVIVTALILVGLFVYTSGQASASRELQNHLTHSTDLSSTSIPPGLIVTPTPTPIAKNIELIGQLGGVIEDMAIQGDYIYLGGENGLTIFEASALPDFTQVNQLQLPVEAIDIRGTYAYLAMGEAGLQVLDISDPAQPVEAGFYTPPGRVKRVLADRGRQPYGYLALDKVGLQIVDISNPAYITEIVLYEATKSICDMAVSSPQEGRTYLYLADCAEGLQVIDVSDPKNPVKVASLFDWANRIIIVGNYVYVVSEGEGLRVVDISKPATPVEVARYGEYIIDLAQVTENYLYVIGWKGLAVLDISNPARPMEVSTSYSPSINPYADSSTIQQEVMVAFDHYLLVNNWQGLHILEVSDPATPIELNVYNPLRMANNLVIDDHYAYVAQGASYNSSTAWGGLSRVDISDPTNPITAGFYETDWPAYEVDVAQGYVYIAQGHCSFGGAACYGGVSVLSGTNQLELIEAGYAELPIIPGVSPNPISFMESWLATGVVVKGDYTYATGIAYGEGGGLQILKLSNPITPTVTSIITRSLNTEFWNPFSLTLGDTQENPYAYLADYDSGLRIVDISNPTQPVEVGAFEAKGIRDVAVSGPYAYLANEEVGLQVIDISNPTTPVEVGIYPIKGTPWELAVSGAHIYVAAADKGLRVVDVADPANPVEVGFYDTPGWASGVTLLDSYIYLADGDGGLYILRYNPTLVEPSEPPQPVDPRLPPGP